MALLPAQVGSVTLMRPLGTDGVTDRFVGISDEFASREIVVRKVNASIARDRARMASLRSRIGDLLPIRHEHLLAVRGIFDHDGSTYIVEDSVDSVTLADIIAWCRENDTPVPHNIFLDLAVQITNGLEALHTSPGATSAADHVLHLAMRPESIFVTRDGDVRLGLYGLERSPTLAPHSGGIRLKQAYLSPEQTNPGQSLNPASDFFSLGAVLFEVLTLKPLFQDSTPLRTLAKVRKAVITTELLEVKEILPGFDRVLYRALAANQRHRYPQAFVLRGDVRGLMAGFSFSDIRSDCREFLAPLFRGNSPLDEALPTPNTEGGDVAEALADFDFNEYRTEELEAPMLTVEPMGLAMAKRAPVPDAIFDPDTLLPSRRSKDPEPQTVATPNPTPPSPPPRAKAPAPLVTSPVLWMAAIMVGAAVSSIGVWMALG